MRNFSILILVVRKLVFGVTDQVRYRAVQSQKIARGLKFLTYEVEGLYYPCSEADLRLCFRICKKPVSSRRGSFDLLSV